MFYFNPKNNQNWGAETGKISWLLTDSIFKSRNSWIMFFLLWGCTAQQLRNKNLSEDNEFNSLIQEKSSFLRQYAFNPVDWNPWSIDILQEAKESNKIIFLSIGYSSSHASHAMEKTTFRDSNFVALLNEHTIPILIDREERPDLAEYYQGFCDFFNEQTCAFPLNIILLPDTKPLFSASVLRPEIWNDLLLRYIRLYQQVPDEAEEIGFRLDQQMKQYFLPQNSASFRLRTDLRQEDLFEDLYLKINAGNRNPANALTDITPEILTFTANLSSTGNRRAQLQLEKQLQVMSMGGTYDHLGGGFFLKNKDINYRYPDFEKLLADNAKKLDLFAKAFHLSQNRTYERILYESTESLERDFRKDSGTYLSSWDSYSEGEEGGYYLWSHIEIDAELGANSALFKRTYNVSREGNWNDRENVLYRELRDEELAYAYRLRPAEFKEELEVLKRQMLLARNKRAKPFRDPHQITSWNARLVQAYISAYRSTHDKNFLSMAQRLTGIMEDQQLGEFPRLFHIPGQDHEIEFLEDYAQVRAAYLDLHQATLNERYLFQATELLSYTLSRFYNARSGLFNFSFGGEDFQAAPFISLQDGILENANAVMCAILLKAGLLLGKNTYIRTAERMFEVVGPLVKEHPEKYASWTQPLIQLKEGIQLIVIQGNDQTGLLELVDTQYQPTLMFDTKFPAGQQQARSRESGPYFLCKNGRCSEGIKSVEEVWQRLR